MFKHWNRFLSSVTKDCKDDPKGEHGLRQRWPNFLKFFFFFIAMTAKITQKIVMGDAAWWYLLDIFVIFLTQENICDLTLSLPECLMEFCKVNVTLESADKILCCACMATQMKALCLYFHRMLFLFQLSQKEIWKFGQNLLLAKFGSKQIIDQKKQQPWDIGLF